MPGVETMVPLMLQEVVEKRLDLSRLVNSMAEAPADRLGISRGRIEKGQPADFMFVNLNKSEKIDVDISFKSHGPHLKIGKQFSSQSIQTRSTYL